MARRPELLTIKHGNGRTGALMEMYCNVEGLSTLLNVGCKCCRQVLSRGQWGR